MSYVQSGSPTDEGPKPGTVLVRTLRRIWALRVSHTGKAFAYTAGGPEGKHDGKPRDDGPQDASHAFSLPLRERGKYCRLSCITTDASSGSFLSICHISSRNFSTL